MSPRRQPETIAIIKDARPGRNKERFGITAVTSRSGKHFYRSLAAHTIVIGDIDRVKRPFTGFANVQRQSPDYLRPLTNDRFEQIHIRVTWLLRDKWQMH